MSRKKRLHKRLEDLFQDFQEDIGEAEALSIMPEAIHGWGWHSDAAGRYTACDESIADILGYTPEEVIGQAVATFALTAESQQKVAAALQADHDAPAEIEVHFLDKQGRPHNAWFYITQRDEQGGWHGFVRMQTSESAFPAPKPAPRPQPQPPQPQPAPSYPDNGTWDDLLDTWSLPRGVRANDGRVEPASGPLSPAGKEALQRGTPAITVGDDGAAMAVPLELSRQKALLEAIDPTPNRYWDEDEQRLVEQVAEQLALALENAQLFQTAQRRANELEILHKLTSAVTRTLDIEAIFSEALEQLRPLFHFEAGLVSQIAPEGDHLELLAHSGVPEALVQRFQQEGIPLEESPCGHTFRHHDILDIEDLTQPPKGIQAQRWVDAGFRSYIGAPIVYQGEPLGTICMLQRTPHKTTEHERRLLRTVAQQVASAVANARLFQQTKEALSTTERLYQATAALNAASSYEEVLQTVAEYLGDEVRMISLGVFDQAWRPNRPDSYPKYIYPIGFWKRPDIQLDTSRLEKLRSDRFPVEECGLLSLTDKESHAFFVENTDTENRWTPTAQHMYRDVFGGHAVAFLPLQVGNRWLGFLNIIYDKPVAFTPERRRQVLAIAGQASIAIENLRSVETVRRHSKEVETLYDVAARFNAASSYQEILDILYEYTPLGEKAVNISLNMFNRPWDDPDDIPEWSIVMARWTKLPTEALAERYPLKQFPAARLLSPDEPLLITDLETDERIDEQTRALYVQKFQGKSTVFFPLITGGRWVGYINAIYEERRVFTEEGLRFLQTAVAQAATAAQNLRRYEVVQHYAQNLELASITASEIAAVSQNLDKLLNTAVELIRERFGFYHASVFLMDESNTYAVIRASTGKAAVKKCSSAVTAWQWAPAPPWGKPRPSGNRSSSTTLCAAKSIAPIPCCPTPEPKPRCPSSQVIGWSACLTCNPPKSTPSPKNPCVCFNCWPPNWPWPSKTPRPTRWNARRWKRCAAQTSSRANSWLT